MTAIEPEHDGSGAQPQEPLSFPALIAEMVDTAAVVINALDAARQSREEKEDACTRLGDLLAYIDRKAPGTDPEVTDRVIKVLSVLEGISG